MVYGRFQYGSALVKEGSVLLKGGESGRTLLSVCDYDGGGYRAFLFVLNKLDICCIKRRILIINGYHIVVAKVIHSKLVIDGGC